MHDLALIDIWRDKHPAKKQYTWSQSTPRIQCRLDYFLIPKKNVTATTAVNIKHSISSDHNMVVLDLKLETLKRGRGTWKFNNSLLNCTEFLEKMNLFIDKNL